jgi:hypothetical protein
LCALYQSAPKLKEEGVHLVSCDEKTGMQAIERMASAPSKAWLILQVKVLS